MQCVVAHGVLRLQILTEILRHSYFLSFPNTDNYHLQLQGSGSYMAIIIFLKSSHRRSLDDVHTLILVITLIEGGKLGCKQTRHCNQITRPEKFSRYCA